MHAHWFECLQTRNLASHVNKCFEALERTCCGMWLWVAACGGTIALQALVEGGGIDPSILPSIAVASWVGADHAVQSATGSWRLQHAKLTCEAACLGECNLTKHVVSGELHVSAVPAALASGNRRALRLLAILAGCMPQGVPQGSTTCSYRVWAAANLQICLLRA